MSNHEVHIYGARRPITVPVSNLRKSHRIHLNSVLGNLFQLTNSYATNGEAAVYKIIHLGMKLNSI